MAGSFGSNYDYGDSLYKDDGASGSFSPTTYPAVPISSESARMVSFSLALQKEQGVIGHFSENTGDDCFFCEPGFSGLKVEDSNGVIRHLGLDDNDGLVYDIALKDGPTDSGLVKYWKDKVNISGNGGTDIGPSVLFPGDSGTFENFLLKLGIYHVFARAADHENRGATGYDSSGFLDDIEFLLELFVDGERSTAERQSKNVPITGGIHVDDEVEGHVIQGRLSANKGSHIIVGRKASYIVKDKPIGDMVMTEDDYQEEMCQPAMWFSSYPLYTDRSNGNELSSTIQDLITAAEGVTGDSETAWSFASAIELPSISLTNGTIMLWHQGLTSIEIGGSAITLTEYDTVGSWSLSYATGLTESGVVTITPSGTGKVFDARAFNSEISTDAIEYYYDNINDHNGDVVLP